MAMVIHSLAIVTLVKKPGSFIIVNRITALKQQNLSVSAQWTFYKIEVKILHVVMGMYLCLRLACVRPCVPSPEEKELVFKTLHFC